MHSTRTFVITVSNDRVSCRARTLNRNFAHAAAVIVYVPTVAWQSLAIVTSCLEQLDLLTKTSMINDARRLDHCDVTASRSGFGVATDVPHSEVELQTEFKSLTAAHSGSNTNQHTDWTLGGTCIISRRSVYAPYLVQSVRLHLYKYRGVTMLTGFPRTRRSPGRFRESYAVRISMQISRMFKFRVITPGLHGYCSSSTLGSRANDYVKTASFALLPRVLDEQHHRSPVIIP